MISLSSKTQLITHFSASMLCGGKLMFSAMALSLSK
jgi:hypothetical protein